MTKIAETDQTITDEATGLEHKVFAGQQIPGHLLSEEDRNDDPNVIGGSSTQPKGVIAEQDETREDPNTGLTYKVVAGQPIPPHLLTEQEQQQEQTSPEGEQPQEEEQPQEASPAPATRRTKVQRAPDKET